MFSSDNNSICLSIRKEQLIVGKNKRIQDWASFWNLKENQLTSELIMGKSKTKIESEIFEHVLLLFITILKTRMACFNDLTSHLFFLVKMLKKLTSHLFYIGDTIFFCWSFLGWYDQTIIHISLEKIVQPVTINFSWIHTDTHIICW